MKFNYCRFYFWFWNKTIFRNIKDTSTPFFRDLDSILERIKEGKSKELIKQIRSEKNKDVRQELKKSLPAICFSGTFNKRADDSIIEHSGFICLDFDGYKTKKDIKVGLWTYSEREYAENIRDILSKELDLIKDMSKSPYGIVIVVGPTGSGKSTTLYSMLSALNKPGVNISTVEDPVEYTLDGIHQVQVIREKGLDFSRALRSLMRQDPDIILVGETRDKETAQAAMEAALTGHMVFTTLHANDTATAITRLAEMEIPPYLIGASIIGVVAQRLVRKVCKSCTDYKKVNHKDNQMAALYGVEKARFINTKNKSCSLCNGTGYKGRVGIYEVMKVNETIRELIMNQSNADDIRERAFDKAGRSLLSYGMNLVKNELTTIEEVERVCLLKETEEKEL